MANTGLRQGLRPAGGGWRGQAIERAARTAIKDQTLRKTGAAPEGWRIKACFGGEPEACHDPENKVV